MRTTVEKREGLTFNHASLRNALKELGIDYIDGPKEFVMQCIFRDCVGHKHPFYLNSGDKPGIWHCFRCDRRGDFSLLVLTVTGWSAFRVGSFLAKHKAYHDPDDIIERKYTPVDLTEETLDRYAFRHAYCYDRKLTETTLRRYRVGYDKEQNEISFPWFDRVGALVAVKKRSVPVAGAVTKYYRFEAALIGFNRTFFGLHLIKPKSIVWLAEGEFDGMYLDQCFRQASLTEHGAGALGGRVLQKAAREELLKKAPTLVVLATDNDDEGCEAAETIAAELKAYVPTYRMKFQRDVKDPNESSFDHIVTEAKNAKASLDVHSAHINTRHAQWLQERTTT